MRPRLQLFRSGQSVTSALRSVPNSSSYQVPLCLRLQQRRSITADEKPLPKAEQQGPGPNQEQLPHVSEEAAEIGKITGAGGPEIEQGTPVTEILKRDEDSQKKAPQVLKEDVKSSSSKGGTRSFSTSTRRRDEAMISFESARVEALNDGFGLPELPLPNTANMKHRYEPVVQQVTKLLMRHGKLAVAQRNMALILTHLRTTSPPMVNPNRPLLPGSPPAHHLPLDPTLYLTLAIDSVAPLLRIRSQKGAAGGGVALQIPIPLGLRQRRRTAVMWILDAASKKKSRGSGKGQFAQKVAEELVSIVEGRSGVWDKRGGVHKLGISARANLSFHRRR